MAGPPSPASRPLSPHLQVYRWPVTMAMSILHRATACALYAGTLLLALWIVAAAAGPAWFARAQAVVGSPIGLLVLFGYTWVLFHHMLGGIRHFVWDLGHGLGPGVRDRLAWANVWGSVALTLLAWTLGLWMSGAFGR